MQFISSLKQFLMSMIIVKKIIKKLFNKNLFILEDQENFHLSNSCWICDKLFDVGDDKVSDHIILEL